MYKSYFHTILFLIFLVAGGEMALGQEKEWSDTTYFRAYVYEGETFMTGQLAPVFITAQTPTQRQVRKGKRKLAKFTRLRWNVHRVYPYAVRVSEILAQAEREMAAMPNEKERDAYLKEREKALFAEYEPALRKMSRTQGKVLVKLIFRETGNSTYYLIKDTKSGASAFLWQSVGRLFGINLKKEYDPEEDLMIEAIVQYLERGGYNIAYREYGYRLTDI
ncbi:MAG: DUF4294 domain-containing protein [Bacteroidota bacterium]